MCENLLDEIINVMHVNVVCSHVYHLAFSITQTITSYRNVNGIFEALIPPAGVTVLLRQCSCAAVPVCYISF